MSDPSLVQVPVRESVEPLIDVETSAPLRVAGPGSGPMLRFGVVERLVVAQSLLPRDVHLVIVAGHRPGDDGDAHPTGGAVDLALFDAGGEPPAELPCCDCDPVTPASPACVRLMTEALTAAGLVNDVARWWHWSYGDRFWAYAVGASHARYGPVTGLQ
ncbi:hypothetical protein [Actinoplanes sp. NPDC049265]|uniref:hypothetical protein n=1 Tax=Actinoplanes sp. NPDC049265 TaxID=3363902 RepID=UPI00372064BB